MEDYSPELLKYQRYADLYGNPVDVIAGRRNGNPAVFLRPSPEDSASPESQGQTHD